MGRECTLDSSVPGPRPGQPLERIRVVVEAKGRPAVIQLADGPFFVVCVEEDQWQRLADYLGRPEWTQWEIFSDRLVRAQNGDALMPLLEEALSHLTCERAYVELQERRIPCSPIFDVAMPHIEGYHHLSLSVTDLAASTAWYGATLGLEVDAEIVGSGFRRVRLRAPGRGDHFPGAGRGLRRVRGRVREGNL